MASTLFSAPAFVLDITTIYFEYCLRTTLGITEVALKEAYAQAETSGEFLNVTEEEYLDSLYLSEIGAQLWLVWASLQAAVKLGDIFSEGPGPHTIST